MIYKVEFSININLGKTKVSCDDLEEFIRLVLKDEYYIHARNPLYFNKDIFESEICDFYAKEVQ